MFHWFKIIAAFLVHHMVDNSASRPTARSTGSRGGFRGEMCSKKTGSAEYGRSLERQWEMALAMEDVFRGRLYFVCS